jgi:hypothetical protein
MSQGCCPASWFLQACCVAQDGRPIKRRDTRGSRVEFGTTLHTNDLRCSINLGLSLDASKLQQETVAISPHGVLETTSTGTKNVSCVLLDVGVGKGDISVSRGTAYRCRHAMSSQSVSHNLSTRYNLPVLAPFEPRLLRATAQTVLSPASLLLLLGGLVIEGEQPTCKFVFRASVAA